LVDGSNVFVETIKVPFYGENGEIEGLIGISRDITQRKQAEAALFEHQQQLLAINLTLEQRVQDEVQKNRDKEQILLQQDKMASIGQLAAGVAHEINNPMGFLSSNLRKLTEYFDELVEYDKLCQEKGLVELPASTRDILEKSRESLQIDDLLEDGVDLIKESLQGAKRVSKIVQDLKNFSRVDSLLEYETVDLSSCMESALNICYNELKYVANIQKNYAPIPEVLCNPGQLNQVFLNLLVNAGQALVPPGEIFLSSWHDDLFVYCAVRDTGSGIPEGVMKRIFDPFFTTKEVGTGTGLGLSISYEIIKQHNGDLLVESTVGVGTTFTVKLPRQSESSL
jgi:signal transduction histidine kinase